VADATISLTQAKLDRIIHSRIQQERARIASRIAALEDLVAALQDQLDQETSS
jgi:hypothetical protein